jgi:1-acyl-sn-glycerol-3-phosphate acyltransferase
MTDSPAPEPDDPFAEIRPYSNLDAPEVLGRLSRDTELAETIALWRLPRLSVMWPAVARQMGKVWLRLAAQRLRTVEDLQNLIAPNLSRMIKKTSFFTVSGIEQLDLGRARVYLSNHRDIVMDPAYANYALHRAGANTLAIAIGDNLLSKPWVADLMRLNKSFVVKRNLGGPRALLAATKLLSQYIRDSVSTARDPIWIAHREGRAKDGRDLTEPAVIKMLTLSRDRSEPPEAVLTDLNIVPLVISYEVDPCDALKAAELAAGEGYVKAEFEDVSSIARGITGDKGCVHLHFGEPLPADLSVEEVVAALDQQMARHYRLYQTNRWAWEWLHGEGVPVAITFHEGSVTEQSFRARIDSVPSEHRQWLLTMYANPVSRQLALDITDKDRSCD